VCPYAQIREDKTIRCVLVHDHVLLRQGLRRLLEDEPDMRVVDEASSAAEALPRILQHRPEVVIADAQIFEGAAEQTERMILQGSPNSKVFFLTQQNGETQRDARSGRKSFAARETSAEELVTMVRKTVAPERVVSGDVRAREVTEFPLEEVVPRKRVLTAREREVLKLLAEGRTVRSAAGVLGLSAKTVDAHKFNLMRKLGIHNKAELVMWAIQKRVVKLPVNF
jgi:two-component system, NarL family, response regulator NreC